MPFLLNLPHPTQAGFWQSDKARLAQQYLETLKTMTEGDKSKTVFLPYEATGVLSSLGGIKELLSQS